jgi:amidophosphoribosyltransferase
MPVPPGCRYRSRSLIANTHTVEEFARWSAPTSLGFLSLDGLVQAIGARAKLCNACFHGGTRC